MPPADGEIQRRLREFENPTWGYCLNRKGEIVKDLFEGHIPVGWADTPAHAQEVFEGQADPGPSLDQPYDQHSVARLRAEIKARTGDGPKRGVKKDPMVETLNRLDEMFFAGREDTADEDSDDEGEDE